MAFSGRLEVLARKKTAVITALVLVFALAFPLIGGSVVEFEICDLEFDSNEDPAVVIAIYVFLGLLGGSAKSAVAPTNVDFEPNLGQFRSDVQFASSTQSWSFETAAGAAASLHYRSGPDRFELVRMNMDGGSTSSWGQGEQLLPGRTNYILGRDPSKWATDVPRFAKVRYRNVYPGIDAVHSFHEGRIETDFEIQPGADPNRIRVRFDGVDELAIDERDSSLLLRVRSGEVHWGQTRIYQESANGKRKAISGRIKILDSQTAGFEVGDYDRTAKLVIDPVLNYLTYSGRNGSEGFTRAAVDANGNLYTVGATSDITFPVSSGAFQRATPTTGRPNLTLTKHSADGSQLMYVTHFGGSSVDIATGIALDATGNIYITGVTASPDYPVSANGFQRTYPERDKIACFVTKLNPAGNAMVYSTYLNGAGTDGCTNIAVDSTGAAFVTGATSSGNFPVTEDAFQGAFRPGAVGATRAFVTKLNPAGSALVYSTFLGGAGRDYGMSIAIDNAGAAYVAGVTNSPGTFPITTGAAQSAFGGSGGLLDYQVGDAFAAKLSADGSRLLYSTYVGGRNDDYALAIAVDTTGSAYVTGATLSPNFPVTANAVQTAYAGSGGGHLGSGDAFLVKINPAGSAFTYATYLGGARDERGGAVAVDRDGNAWVAGHTLSTNFPISADAAQKTFGGTVVDFANSGDGFVTQINAAGSRVLYSTYVGGSANEYISGLALARDGSVLFGGGTASRNLPTTANAAQRQGGQGEPNLAPFGDGMAGRIGEPAPLRVSVSGVASYASFATGAVAPGLVVAITGSGMGPVEPVDASPGENGQLPVTLADTRVLFDGVAAPLVSVSDKRVIAIVPFALDGKASTQLVVENKTDRSAPITIAVMSAQPGIFTADGSGAGLAVAVNEDGNLNSADAPAGPGSLVTILLSGLGQTNPASVDGLVSTGEGLPVPVQPVKVLLGETEVEVLSATVAPNRPAGYFVVQFRVPDGLEAGSAAITVRAGDASSQKGVVIAVAGGNATASASVTRRRR